jgi:hypothetical protein
MRKLSLIFMVALTFGFLPGKSRADSPHGKDFRISCDVCHSSKGWKLDMTVYSFDHNSTKFPLTGEHQVVNCRSCHPTLVFAEAKTQCVDCHTDMHYQTVGPDCGRCHTTKSWIVDDITGLHQRGRFPLLGAHYTANCTDCHKSASQLRFDPLGVNCIDCHQANYVGTTNPNHVLAGYSTNCTDCHSFLSFTWTGAGFNHNLFPLTGGHANVNCDQCHVGGNFSNIPTECVACHINNYNATTNPNHAAASIPTTCADCHSTAPGWKPASYPQHDAQFFPIYSGKHQGTWNVCSDCHSNPANYGSFTCIDCHAHNQQDMDSKHGDVGGYTYNSLACFECHPTGSGEGNFNHNTSGFPLTGGHSSIACSACHSTGFVGTPTECSACHINKYNQTTDPNHNGIGIPTTCATCHTTQPGWKPATFPIHNNYFKLTGEHAIIANDCGQCHKNGYNNTPNTCVGCHQADFNGATNPSHTTLGLPTDCNSCHHTGPAWKPALFPIHGNYYELTGGHATIANDCYQCHQNNYNNTPNTCVGCHQSNYDQTTNPPHSQIGISTNCVSCHTTNPGWTPALFTQHADYWPFTGGHIPIQGQCNLCHINNNYNNTPNTCVGCHQTDYNNTNNPPHSQIGISTNCVSCHTTAPGWTPALFSQHADYWPFQGAHIAISGQCNLCHINNNYTNIPNTCVGCHLADYNATSNPPHASAQFPTDCILCHTQNAWTPSTFNHDGQYFPIYSGSHNGKWNLCSDCHPNQSNFGDFTCTTSCHPQTQMNNDHQGVSGYSYNSNACYSCHPNGQSPMMRRPGNENKIRN